MADGDRNKPSPGKPAPAGAAPDGGAKRDEFEDFMSDLAGFLSDPEAKKKAAAAAAPKPATEAKPPQKEPTRHSSSPPRSSPGLSALGTLSMGKSGPRPAGAVPRPGAGAARPEPMKSSDLPPSSLAAPRLPREAASFDMSKLPPLPTEPEAPASAKTESQRPTMRPREDLLEALLAETQEPEERKTPDVAFPKSNLDRMREAEAAAAAARKAAAPPKEPEPLSEQEKELAELDWKAASQPPPATASTPESPVPAARVSPAPPPGARLPSPEPPRPSPPAPEMRSPPPASPAPEKEDVPAIAAEAAEPAPPRTFSTMPPFRPKQSGLRIALLVACAGAIAIAVAWTLFSEPTSPVPTSDNAATTTEKASPFRTAPSPPSSAANLAAAVSAASGTASAASPSAAASAIESVGRPGASASAQAASSSTQAASSGAASGATSASPPPGPRPKPPRKAPEDNPY